MSILATNENPDKIIRRASDRVGDNHAKVRDNKGISVTNEGEVTSYQSEHPSRVNGDSSNIEPMSSDTENVIEEALKEAANEEAIKLVLENTIQTMVKEEVSNKVNHLHKYNFKSHGPFNGTENGKGYAFKSGGPEQFDSKEKFIEELKKRLTDTIKEQYTEKTPKIKNIKPGKVHNGLKKYEDVHKEDGKENSKSLKDVEKKMKEYLNIDNNSNPEFPHQNNSKTDYNSPMYRNNSDQDEYVEDWRGTGLEDLEYDTEPSEEFKTRFKDYLEGSAETGNSDEYANAVPSKNGDRLNKKVKRKHKKLESPEYSGAIPNDWVQKPNAGFIPENIEENINDMKKLWGYSKPTQ